MDWGHHTAKTRNGQISASHIARLEAREAELSKIESKLADMEFQASIDMPADFAPSYFKQRKPIRSPDPRTRLAYIPVQSTEFNGFGGIAVNDSPNLRESI